MPVPTDDQDVPFHLAILWTGTPPAVSNCPAAYNSPLYTTKDDTQANVIEWEGLIVNPVPKLDQDEPSHAAILNADFPPILSKTPATIRSLL